jgi:hypothetical protein
MSDPISTFDIATVSITTLSTVVSAGAAIASWKVAQSLLRLQNAVEADRKLQENPLVQIWFDNSGQTFEGSQGELSIINLGGRSLAIRTLDVIHGGPANEKRLLMFIKVKASGVSFDLDGSKFTDKIRDLVLKSDLVHEILLKSPEGFPSQFKIRVMYYDNSFETVDVDTANLGGKYVLTGKGK